MSKVAGEWTQVVTYHQELTADLPRLAASLHHSTPLLSPSFSDRWCEGSGRQRRTIPLPRDRRREARNHFGTELRPSARPPSAAPRPVTAKRRSRCPPRGDQPRRGHFQGHICGSAEEWSISAGQPVLGPVSSRYTGAAAGGGRGEPTLPAPLSGRCQCKCQGDVPTQAGEPAAPVPERNNT